MTADWSSGEILFVVCFFALIWYFVIDPLLSGGEHRDHYGGGRRWRR